MLTRESRIGPSTALLLLATGLLVGIIVIGQAPNASGTDGVGPLPPDITALGVEVTRASPEGKISSQDALDIAQGEFSDITKAALDAYLIELTNPMLLDGLKDRAIWVIKATGVSLPVYGTFHSAGPSTEVTAGTVLYIYVDALTGEWLLAHTE
jgi:hypothetical protein